ncbi:MAG: hypothetical protein VKQ33_10095 [Candidatus Sericytochromatia bacterium]|nr:hypothetical protein [Candidatus Sericytochromatia bacterium]
MRQRLTASLLLVALLSGCGAQGLAPARATAVAATVSRAAAAEAAQVTKLIAAYQAIVGHDAAALAQRGDLLVRLGDTDDDRAVALVQSEYAALAQVPEAHRAALEAQLIDALDGLDTYDPALDDPIIAAGPGTTAEQQKAYADAMARRKRRKGLVYWLTSPFRWAGDGLKWLGDRLAGKKKSKRKKRRKKPKPTYPDYPSYPSDPYPPTPAYP